MPEIIELSNGKKVTITAIPVFLVQKVQQSVTFPKVPQYVAKTVAGVEEYHDHDETTLSTDEERAAWEAYKVEKAAADQVMNDKMLKLVVMKSMVIDMPEDSEWEEMQKFIGIDEIPTDGEVLDRKYYYATTELISTPDDLTKVLTTAMKLSGVGKEAIEEVERMFQSAVEEAKSQ